MTDHRLTAERALKEITAALDTIAATITAALDNLATGDAPARTLAEELRDMLEARDREDPTSFSGLLARVEQVEQERNSLKDRDHLAAEIDKANTDILHLTADRDEARAEVERLTAVAEDYARRATAALTERDEARAEAKTWREQDENDCEAHMEELASVREALTVEGRRVEKIAHDRAEARARVERLTTERDAYERMYLESRDEATALAEDLAGAESEVERLTVQKGAESNAETPDPADVKPGEAWIVNIDGVEIVPGFKTSVGWICYRFFGGTTKAIGDERITLVSRLVPAPRVITNPDDLDKMAEGTIVRDKDGDAWRRTCDEWTTTADYGRFTSWAVSRSGPATVLWEPEA